MIKLTVTGVDTVVKQLKAYRDTLDRRIKRLQEELALIGIQIASTGFATAQYDGTPDVQVSPSPEWVDDHTVQIAAWGTTVLFIEFGTGLNYPDHPEPLPELSPRGTYGQGKAGSPSKTWTYYGEQGSNGVPLPNKPSVIRTRGNPPARAMYDAGKEMRKAVSQVIAKVWSE